ncbi:MAG: glucokinase [Frankiales bacterium]|nr:glucokinase [Frankiales bacterium]
MTVLAIEVGSAGLTVGLTEQDGRLIASKWVVAPQGLGAESVFETLLLLADDVHGRSGSSALQGIGVSCGGSVDWPAGVVTPLGVPDWVDFPLRERLQQRYPRLPVRVHHEAHCFTAAEHWTGAGRRAANLLGVVMSADVEGGLVLRGRLVDGGTGNAGNLGHVVVDPVGPVCSCGGIGCLAAVAGGPAIVDWAREHGWIAGASAGAPELAASARAGDPVASAALALAGTAVGIAISSVAALLDLDVVVVGGGLADSGEILFGPMRRAVERHLRVPYGKRLEVLHSGCGRQASLVGAAALVLRGDDYWSAG